MLHEIKFASSNGRDEVTGWIYVPAIAEPEGIVQLVHGFGEHSRRYFHLIVSLMEAGYIVAADDHVGHGATAIANNPSVNDYNPFFIYGPSGVGKTHLMFAIENEILRKHPEKKSIYVRGEDFTNAFIKHLLRYKLLFTQ